MRMVMKCVGKSFIHSSLFTDLPSSKAFRLGILAIGVCTVHCAVCTNSTDELIFIFSYQFSSRTVLMWMDGYAFSQITPLNLHNQETMARHIDHRGYICFLCAQTHTLARAHTHTHACQCDAMTHMYSPILIDRKSTEKKN